MPTSQLRGDAFLFNQKKRKRATQLHALYAAVDRELLEETNALRLERERIVAATGRLLQQKTERTVDTRTSPVTSLAATSTISAVSTTASSATTVGDMSMNPGMSKTRMGGSVCGDDRSAFPHQNQLARPLTAGVTPETLLRGTSFESVLQPSCVKEARVVLPCSSQSHSASGAREEVRQDNRGKKRRGNRKSKKDKEGKDAGEASKATGSAAGPFSDLDICAVRLGSVTKNTIATWARELNRLGGRVSTFRSPETTHVVVDAALSWPTLHRYSGWAAHYYGNAAIEGEGSGSNASYGCRTPHGERVPLVGCSWMIECLKRSHVVPVDAYVLSHPASSYMLPPPPPPPKPTMISAHDHTVATKSAGDERADTPSLVSGNPSAPSRKRSGSVAPIKTGENPLEEGEPSTPGAEPRVGEENDSSTARPDSRVVKGGFGCRRPDIGEKRSNFFCQTASSRDHKPCNGEAAAMMENLGGMYTVVSGEGSTWRERGFKRAAAVLRGLGTEVTNIRQLRDMKKSEPRRLKGVGDSAMALLEEFYKEGRMGRLEGLSSQPKVKILKTFEAIWGVGRIKAEELYDAGFCTIEDVRARGRGRLSTQQLIGLKRYEDLLERMPRTEAAEIEATVTAAASSLCANVQSQACGSYRRGKQSCGDVDILICPQEGEEDCSIMLDLLDKLRASGFITDDLAIPNAHRPGHPQSYMGVCKLPGDDQRHRRIDIKLYPTSMYGFAVLYFTGSGHFNCSMRNFARLKGLSLSDKGLKAVNRVEGIKVHSFPSYRCPKEEDVFVALGLEWRDPKDRGGFDINPVSGEAARSGSMDGSRLPDKIEAIASIEEFRPVEDEGSSE